MSQTITNVSKFVKELSKTLYEAYETDAAALGDDYLQKIINDVLSKYTSTSEDSDASEAEETGLEKGDVGDGDESESVHTEDSSESEEAPKKTKGKAVKKAPAKTAKKAPAKAAKTAKGKAPAKKAKGSAPAKGKAKTAAPKGKKVAVESGSEDENTPKDLSKMKLPELKALAKERKVDIKGKTKKDDIVAALEAAGGEKSEDEASDNGSEKSEAGEDVDFDSLTLAELKTRIDTLNEGREKADKISKVGKKADLIERLKEASE